MLAYENRLLFPRLRRLGEARLDKGDEESTQKPRGLFQLDWQSCDALKLDDHINWAKEQHPGEDVPFIHTLPPIVDETVKRQFFALNEAYLRAIRDHAHRAQEVWGQGYRMDTMARGQARAPAGALVWSALWMLGDCAYDPDTRYYIRTSTKIILPHAMAWKFWQHQVGRGLLWRKARLDRLETRGMANDDIDGMLDDFISRMKEHQDELMAAYDALDLRTKRSPIEPEISNREVTCSSCHKIFITSAPIDKAECPHCGLTVLH